LAFALGIGSLASMPRIASASPCPVDPAIGPVSAALDERDPGERTTFLQGRIETAAGRSRIWAASWGAGLGALTIGQLAIAPFVPREERIDFWVGAGASGIGALSRAVFVPIVLRERRRLARLPASASACERLAATERAVAVAARGERQGRALWMHGLNLAYNAGVGLVLGLAFRRSVAGHRLAAMGAVVGEVMIVTQPVVMVRTLEHYRAGALFGPGTWRAHPMVLQGGGGLGFVGAM
jgi:hypothetical protein